MMIPNRTSGWWRTVLSALTLVLVSGAASRLNAGVIEMSDCLPPLDPYAAYLGQFHRYDAGGTIFDLTSPVHSAFTSCDPPPGAGMMTTHSFNSTVSGDLFVNGSFFGPFMSNAMTTVQVTFDGMSGPTRFFDTEMLQLDISGGSLMIRESPTRASTGQTTITDLGSGMYHIDSFFDVFTELSLDGGQSWIPSSGPGPGGSTQMTLETIPEPASLLLVATGLAGFAARRRRTRA